MNDQYISENYYSIVKQYLKENNVSKEDMKKLEIWDRADGKGPFIKDWPFENVKRPEIQDIKRIKVQDVEDEKEKQKRKFKKLVVQDYGLSLPDKSDCEPGELVYWNSELYVFNGTNFKKLNNN